DVATPGRLPGAGGTRIPWSLPGPSLANGACLFSRHALHCPEPAMNAHSASPSAHAQSDSVHDEHHAMPQGWRRWVFATNHKDIGTLYLLFSLTMFLVGGVLALLIRAELFQPGLQLLDPHTYNQMVTMHGIIMVFGAIMPAFVGFANWMVP